MYLPSSRKEFDTITRLEASAEKPGLTHQDDLKVVLRGRPFSDLDGINERMAPLNGDLCFRITHDEFLKTGNDMLNVLSPWQAWDFGNMTAWLQYYTAAITNDHRRKDGTPLPKPHDGQGIHVSWSFMERITSRLRKQYSSAVYTTRTSTREYVIGAGELFSDEGNEWRQAYLVWYVNRNGRLQIERGVRASANRMYRVEPESVYVPMYHYAREVLLANNNEDKGLNSGEIVQYYVKDASLVPFIHAGYRARVSKYMGFTRDHWLAWYAANGVTPVLPFKSETLDSELAEDAE